MPERRTLLVMVSLMFVSVRMLGGCTVRYKVKQPEITEWPAATQVDASINLVLDRDFQTYEGSYSVMGDTFVFELGPPLRINAEMLANRAFRDVKVTESPLPAGSGIDAVLIPKVTHFQQNRTAWAFDPVEMSIDIEWTLTDPHGRTLWVRTIRGSTKHITGNMMTHRREADKRMMKIVTDAYHNSLDVLTTDPQVRQAVRRH